MIADSGCSYFDVQMCITRLFEAFVIEIKIITLTAAPRNH